MLAVTNERVIRCCCGCEWLRCPGCRDGIVRHLSRDPHRVDAELAADMVDQAVGRRKAVGQMAFGFARDDLLAAAVRAKRPLGAVLRRIEPTDRKRVAR